MQKAALDNQRLSRDMESLKKMLAESKLKVQNLEKNVGKAVDMLFVIL